MGCAVWRGRTDNDRIEPVRRAGSSSEESDADDERTRLADRLRGDLVERLAQRGGDAHTQRSLRQLLHLVQGEEGPERTRSAICEAAIALRLVAAGAKIQFEAPTPRGHTADFLVRLDDRSFALHVKRWTPPRERRSTTLRVPRALRRLERIRRPYLVGVRWPADAALLEPFLAEASHFIHQASVGDEWVYRNADDIGVGGVRIIAPWPGDRVILSVGLDVALEEELQRVQRLLRKAHAQFLPGVPNIILLVGGGREDERLLDTAIFGSHIERWDLFPPRGHRVAHGRADDGFWSGERYSDAHIIAWHAWTDERGLGATRLWFRTRRDADPRWRAILRG